MEQPVYEQKIQYVKVDHSAALPPNKIKFLQQVTGKFLFYARAVENTMMYTRNDIVSSTDVESTYNVTVYFINYAACNPDTEIIYQASDMILQVNSDAASVHKPEVKQVDIIFWATQTKRNSMALV